MAPTGAEASEIWYDDPRLDPAEYAGKGIYDQQTVPGFPDPRSTGRLRRMFQRGHLVRRIDPAWGSDKQALAADADTFHWTNCSPRSASSTWARPRRSRSRAPRVAGGRGLRPR
jgi:endonuclease G